MPYRRRIVDYELDARIASTGAVVIEGPKACGKTTTARRYAVSEVLLDIDESARRAVAVDPSLVLEGKVPRLIDEWQLEPGLWNHIRRAVDDRGQPGQFILTGSAVPADDVTRHTGAGRLTRLLMRPLSLFETGHSSGEISLSALLKGGPVAGADSGLKVAELVERIAVGGWPGQLDRTVGQSLRGLRDYLEEIRRVDIGRVENRRRDPGKVGRLLRSLARNVATEASVSTLARDAGGSDGVLDHETVRDYLNALERLMIVENQPAWAPNLRSRSILRHAPKRHFVDPALAVAALRASPDRLLSDLELTGTLFESLVVRDLRIYAQSADANVCHYRDNTGLEVDAIVETGDGRWAAFEVKLGTSRIDQAAESLLKLADRVDTVTCGTPVALTIITATGYGYTRDDGVSVVPIAAFGP